MEPEPLLPVMKATAGSLGAAGVECIERHSLGVPLDKSRGPHGMANSRIASATSVARASWGSYTDLWFFSGLVGMD